MNNGIVKKILIGLVCSTPLLMATQTFAVGSKDCFYIANNTGGSFLKNHRKPSSYNITTDGAVSATLETQTDQWPKERLNVCVSGGTADGGSGSVDASIYNVASDLKSASVTLNISESNDQFTVTMPDTDNNGIYLASGLSGGNLGTYTAQKGEGSPVEGVKPDSTLAIVYPGHIKLLNQCSGTQIAIVNLTGENLTARPVSGYKGGDDEWPTHAPFCFDTSQYEVKDANLAIDAGLEFPDQGEVSINDWCQDDDQEGTCKTCSLVNFTSLGDDNEYQAFGGESTASDVTLGLTCTLISTLSYD